MTISDFDLLDTDAASKTFEIIAKEIYEISKSKGFHPEELSAKEMAESEAIIHRDENSEFLSLTQGELLEIIDNARTFNRRNDLEMLMLIVSEISEMVEALRQQETPMSEKLEGFKLVEEEAADVLIRLFDFCHLRGIRLADAVFAKIEYNRNRPFRHGNKKF